EDAVARLRHDVLSSGAQGVDSLEVVLDADGAGQVRIAFGLDVTREEAAGSPAHPAVHGGGHHITPHAPELDELRERLTGPGPGLLRRIRESIGARLLRR